MLEPSVPVAEFPMKKKAYHHGDLRNAIIARATARARENGERAIVLREIAAEIGVSATAAYRHFTNRRQLVEEVAARGFVVLGERMAGVESVAGPGVDAGLAAYVDLRNASLVAVAFARDEPAWARLMIETVGDAVTVMAAGHDLLVVINRIVDRGIDAGVFVPGLVLQDDEVYVAGLAGLCTQAMFGLRSEAADETDAKSTRLLDLCMSGMLTEAGRAALDAAELRPGLLTAL